MKTPLQLLCFFTFIVAPILSYGQEWQWAKGVGASAYVHDYNKIQIVADPRGYTYSAGNFYGEATFGEYTFKNYNGGSIFLAKQAPDGQTIWAKKLDPGKGVINDMVLDPLGGFYITGMFYETLQLDHITISDNKYNGNFFIAKFDAEGNAVWAKSAGDDWADAGHRLAVDGRGNVFVMGGFSNQMKLGAFTLNSIDLEDGLGGRQQTFFAKFDQQGEVLWAKVGGTGEIGHYWESDIATDASGNLLVLGAFRRSVTFGSTTLTSSGYNDIYLAKYNASGEVVWAKKAVEGTEDESASKLEVAKSGDLVITGFFKGSSNFGGQAYTSSQYGDMFIASYTDKGEFKWVQSIKGTHWDKLLWDFALDGSDNIYATGYFKGLLTFGKVSLLASGGDDLFVAKYTPIGDLAWTSKSSGTLNEYGFSVSADNLGNAYVAGAFWNPTSFGNITLTTDIIDDTFFAKVNGECQAQHSANAGTNKSVCSGQATSLGTDKVTGYSYSWYPVIGLSDPGASNPELLLVNNTEQSVTYTYTVTMTNPAGCSDVDEVTVTVNPAINVVVENNSTCGPGVVTLHASGAPEGGSYRWYSSLTATTPLASTSSFTTPSLTATSVYYVSVFSNGCESEKRAVTATVEALLLPPSITANYTYCQGSSAPALTASGESLRWYTTASGGNALTEAPIPNTTVVGTYYYYVSQSNGTCESNRSKITVTVKPVPQAPSATAVASCGPAKLTFTASGGSSGSYRWYTVAKGGTAIENANLSTYTTPLLSSSTTYYVSIVDKGCESARTAVLATIETSPVVDAGADESTCAGAPSFVLSGYSPAGGVWSGRGVTANGTFDPAKAGEGRHILTYRVTRGSCSVSATKTMVVLSTIAAPGLIAGNVALCGGQLTTYTVNAVSGATSYTWTVPDGFRILEGQGGTTIRVEAGAKSGSITVAAQNTCGTSLPSSFDVSVSKVPEANAGNNLSACVNAPAFAITGHSPAGGEWSGPGVTVDGVFDPASAGAGNHTLTYTVSSNGCTAGATKTITVVETPTVSFATIGEVCSLNTSFTLTGGQPVGGSYSGPGVKDGIFDASAVGAGIHEITYTYTSNGCEVTATQQVTVATCTGVEDESKVASEILVFPNPASSYVQVNATLTNNSDVSLALFNPKGQQVYLRTIKDNPIELRQSINLDRFANGLYLLQIITNKGIFKRRVLIAKD